ncbi:MULTISPECIES: hypothetical protein [Nocardia]|uniref:Uncharacterized protein n=2 Tax=Nocardia TaxID=1817 RepID=A0A2T2YU80_9NOCA|nr:MULTISPECIES: hypothetical protein [Nocardia]MBF6446059.1 hypothetical protein [Nocardia elegans]PSR59060.1 hypothetical protein C8259_28385 [Nocardia nova]
MRIDAIGYLRRDVSGVRQPWDEIQIRSLAKRLGYNLRKIITFTTEVDDVGVRVRNIAERLGVEAVFVPSVDHFEGGVVPAKLVEVADVITVEPEYTYARWASGELPAEIGGDQ